MNFKKIINKQTTLQNELCNCVSLLATRLDSLQDIIQLKANKFCMNFYSPYSECSILLVVNCDLLFPLHKIFFIKLKISITASSSVRHGSTKTLQNIKSCLSQLNYVIHIVREVNEKLGYRDFTRYTGRKRNNLIFYLLGRDDNG